jgi:endonuclease III
MPDGPSPVVPLLDRLASLERFYGALPTPPRDAFRFYVWEVLSVQTTPARRDAAYAALRRLPALTPDSMWRAPRGKLEAAVALAGVYHEQRLSALRGGVALFRRHPRLGDEVRGPLFRARRALADLPRLGEGSVARVLLFSGDHCVLPVDRDVARLARRLGIEVCATGARTRSAARSADVSPGCVAASSSRAADLPGRPALRGVSAGGAVSLAEA